MNLGVYPKLTKDYILARISQEEIMRHYLGIDVDLTKLVVSPLRNDSNPTCGFHYNNNGKLRFRDFSGHFWGDCFDVVAYKLGVGTSKKEFMLILHTIAKDFRIHKYEDSKEINNYYKVTKDFFAKRKKKIKTKFKIVFRDIDFYDTHYWNQFNVNTNLLNLGRVYMAQEIYVSKDNLPFVKIYSYNPKDPAYCYYGGKDDKGIDDWKIYLPFRKQRGESGFFSNSSFLQGKHLITCGRVGVITKSYKDVLTLRSIGIQAVAPSAEGVLISKDDYWFMRTKFDYLVSCMDYGTENKLDRAGIRMAKQLRDIYKIEPIMFTNGMFGTTNYVGKDASDFVKYRGAKELTNIIINLLDKYKEDFENLDSYYFNSLKFINENY